MAQNFESNSNNSIYSIYPLGNPFSAVMENRYGINKINPHNLKDNFTVGQLLNLQKDKDPDGIGSLSYSWQTSSDKNWTEVGKESTYQIASNDEGKSIRLLSLIKMGKEFKVVNTSVISINSTDNKNLILREVTVEPKTSEHIYYGIGSSKGFKIDDLEAPTVSLKPGNTYKFDQSDPSNAGHPLLFYSDKNKSNLFRKCQNIRSSWNHWSLYPNHSN